MDSSRSLSPEDIILLRWGGALTPPADGPKKESLRLAGPHSVTKPDALPSISVWTPGPKKETLRPAAANAVTRTLAGPHSIETRTISDEEKKIREIHEMGQNLGIVLWHTPYEAALDPENERFQMYNQIALLDDGTLLLTEIKPGKEFVRTIQVDPERLQSRDPHAKMEGSELVRAIRGHIQQAGFQWNNKPEWYLRSGVTIEEYRALTENYDATTDKEKIEALMDPTWSKRWGAVYAFDREVVLLPDDPRIIFRLRGKHTAPTNKSGAYGIDDILEIIRK